MPIKFYSKTQENAYLSNFSPHGFVLEELYWPTVEHYFQAMKFPTRPDYQEKIRQAKSPAQAKTLGRSRAIPIRPDWDTVKDDIMRRAVQAKFDTHRALKTELIATENETLIEDAPTDYYWGAGRTGTGKNRLGEILMETREGYNTEENT
jgi:N-glycosidase YbiA